MLNSKMYMKYKWLKYAMLSLICLGNRTLPMLKSQFDSISLFIKWQGATLTISRNVTMYSWTKKWNDVKSKRNHVMIALCLNPLGLIG